MPADEVIATCVVEVGIERAFDLFTQDIDRWWHRPDASDSVIRFESDRLVMVTSSGSEVIAEIETWDPPRGVEMSWHGPHSQAGDTVSVLLESVAEGTRVTVRHHRPGLLPQVTEAAVLGLWWGDLLSRLAGGLSSPA